MTTSFFIVGEYNTAFAIAIAVAVRLVTADRLRRRRARPGGMRRIASGSTSDDLSRAAAVGDDPVALYRAAAAVPADRPASGVGRFFISGSVSWPINSAAIPHSAEHLEETW
jgi:hypothetical protein